MYAKIIRLTILYFFIFINGFSLVLAETKGEPKVENKENSFYYKQFQEVFELINREYVKEPDKKKMTDAAINAMLGSLDPHSMYFTDEDLEDFVTNIKGEFGGIGVEVVSDSGAVKVISPIDDLPADKAGIKAGDYIVGVNEELVSNLGFNKAIKEMRGEPGTKVKLLVVNDNESKPRELELVRDLVKIKPVKAHLEPDNIAYVRIVTFNKQTIEELRKSFKNLNTEAKGNLQGVILDLRNNPGGLLEQAVAVSEFFIDSGTIVTTKGRTGTSESVSTSSKFAAKAPKIPMIVLINSGSASAAEIVAGALQDYNRAIIVGTKSFGKGSVQASSKIKSRDLAAVKLTTALYYTPLGRSIQAEGIEPDVIVEVAKVEYPQTKPEEKRFSEASFKNSLKKDLNQDSKDKRTDNKEEEEIKLKKKENKEIISELYKKDYQFARGYDVLRGLILGKEKISNNL